MEDALDPSLRSRGADGPKSVMIEEPVVAVVGRAAAMMIAAINGPMPCVVPLIDQV